MSFSKLSTIVFGVVFIVILYVIIFYALKIMYKDVKSGGKKRPTSRKRNYGLEVLQTVPDCDLKRGSVVPVRSEITIGRKDENSIVLSDRHVSGDHARLFIKNEVLFIEDLKSTNGTFINGTRVEGKAKLFAKDEVTIGNTKFKVLG